jgi:hypothetical protein
MQPYILQMSALQERTGDELGVQVRLAQDCSDLAQAAHHDVLVLHEVPDVVVPLPPAHFAAEMFHDDHHWTQT